MIMSTNHLGICHLHIHNKTNYNMEAHRCFCKTKYILK